MRPAKVSLDKLAVADRQLDTAIWLWFNEGDIASIVTLTGAAMGILKDLFHRAKKQMALPFTDEMAKLADMTPRDARNYVLADQDFAKHARRDHDKSREYCWDRLSCYLFITLATRVELVGLDDHATLRTLFAMR